MPLRRQRAKDLLSQSDDGSLGPAGLLGHIHHIPQIQLVQYSDGRMTLTDV